ncbi:MAG: SDR family oxidoreductase [Chloroflexi bacterium]|nr:SDR family oxidoreductase [Chloroflexota bacterium]
MPLDEFSLDGRVAVVTGAGRGIGRGIALCFAEAGAEIVALARTREQVEDTAAEARRLGRRALAIATDVTKAAQVQEAVDRAMEEFGHIDILVNDAGAAVPKPLVPLPEHHPEGAEDFPNYFAPTSLSEWRTVLDVQLNGAFLCCRAVAPHMVVQRRGKVISISSIFAARGFPFGLSYGVSKTGLVGLTWSLAAEWAAYNIQVNCIAPGHFRTAMVARLHDTPRLRERILRTIPFRRTGDLRDIGLLAVYLASPASDYMTGQVLFVDGGITA